MTSFYSQTFYHIGRLDLCYDLCSYVWVNIILVDFSSQITPLALHLYCTSFIFSLTFSLFTSGIYFPFKISKFTSLLQPVGYLPHSLLLPSIWYTTNYRFLCSWVSYPQNPIIGPVFLLNYLLGSCLWPIVTRPIRAGSCVS